MQNINKQSGFTLVEIAIVLVIIGLLLGGVLKGQEMIKNAEVRSVITDVGGVTAAMYAYRDRYNQLPGDDDNAKVHLSDSTLTDGNGNGVISGGERPDFFEHLRGAKLLKGAGSSNPTHSLGGDIVVENNTYDLNGMVICADDIDGADAMIIDIKEDDGVMITGTIQAGSSGTYAAGTEVDLCFES